MRYFFSKTALLTAAFLSVSEILPDRVKLKSGKVYDNVKTSLNENTLIIRHENGKQERISASEIAELKPGKTDWNPVPKKNPESGISAKEPESPAKTEQPKVNSLSSSEKNYQYLYSLIPGWSSLNTGRYWYLGLGLSLLELGELRRISGKNEIRPLLDNEDARNLQILSVLNGRETGSGNFLRDTLLIGFYHSHTLTGQNADDGLESFINRRNGLIALSILTVIDVFLSRTLGQTVPQKKDDLSFQFTIRSMNRENFSLGFTKNF